VDDSAPMREALDSLLRANGFIVQCFHSAEDFLASGVERAAACLIVDVKLPGLSGLVLQERLRAGGVRAPVILMSASVYWEGTLRARATQLGTIAFLPKPFDASQLLDAIRSGLERSIGR